MGLLFQDLFCDVARKNYSPMALLLNEGERERDEGNKRSDVM